MMSQQTPVYDLFLSYAEADEAWADGYLLDGLRGSGLNVLTQEEFRRGVPLLAEYERAITASRYVILVLSPAWSGETFGEFVDLLANFHGRKEGSWPVVPLLYQPTELPLRLAHLTPIDATSPARWPQALEQIARLLDAPPAPATELPDCPYPGMTPFSEEQEKLFFGRDREIGDGVARLGLHPFLAVIGPSGSGKSSLAYAGIIPALRRSRQFGPGAWDVRSLRPGAHPLAALADALHLPQSEGSVLPPAWGELEGGEKTLLLIDQFEELFTQSDPSEAQPFLDALQALIGQPNLHILLTVRADFYPELMGCSLWDAIQANRLDLPPLGRAELAAAIVQPAAQVGVNVDPLLVEQLTADAAGEKGALPLVQECLRLLWQGVTRRYLPAAAYAALAADGRNGLQIAIDRRANVVYNNLPAEAQPIARRIFLRLIQFGEGRADTRRQVSENDLRAAHDDPARFAETLQTLIDRRLLTASGEGKDGAERRMDIAHEALIGGWALLRGWIDERRAAEQTRRRLEATAQRWEELKREGGLLDPVELAEAQRWLAQPDSREVGGASVSLAALIGASETRIREEEEAKAAAQEREVTQAMMMGLLNARREREQAEARRRTLLLAAALVSAVVVIAVVGWFWRQSQQSEAGAVQARATAEVAATAEATARAAAESEARAAATSEAEAQTQRGIADEQRQLAEAAAAEAEAARKAARAGELAGHALAELDLDANGSKALALLLARQAVLTTWRDDEIVTDAAMYALNKSVREASPWLTDLSGHTGYVLSAAYSPDGSRIVTASDDNTSKIWNADTGQETLTLSGHADPVASAAFSPDGSRIVTASSDNTAKIWNADTGQETLTLFGHTDWVMSAVFSSDGSRIVTASGDGTAKVWNADSGQETLTLSGHTGPVNSAAFSPDGSRIVTASYDNTAAVWDANSGQKTLTLSGHTDLVNFAAFSPDGSRIVTASYDNTAKVWNADTGQETLTLSGHAGDVLSAVFSPDGSRIITAGYGSAKVWNADSSHELLTLSGHAARVWSAAFSPDGSRIVTASDWPDNTAKVWDAESGAELLTLSGHTAPLSSAAFSSDGSRIVTASWDGTAKVWDADTGEELFTLSGHAGEVRSAAFSPDGSRIVTASDDSTAKVWDADSGDELFTLSGHAAPVNSAVFSPDGSRIVTASYDNTAAVWDADSGAELLTLSGHSDSVSTADFSPDGQRVITASADGTAKVWNAASGAELLTLSGYTDWVWSAVFSPDGERIVAASSDHMVKVWNADTGQEVLTLSGHTGDVFSATFSPDGSRIVTASNDGTAKVWLMPDALLDLALSRVQRDPPDFTPEEKARYGIGE